MIAGDTLVDIQSKTGTDEILGTTWVVDGTDLVLSVACPQALELRVPFAATDTELWLFDPDEPNVKVYVKQ